MKVSVIIPVYNAELFLEESVLSALGQSYKEIEIIAVNDGSTDHSADILNKFSDQIKVIHKNQGGVASARNAGIQLATGEWIKLLDNDDVLYPNAISDLIEASSTIDIKNKILYGH